jgi:hypothetical protein
LYKQKSTINLLKLSQSDELRFNSRLREVSTFCIRYGLNMIYLQMERTFDKLKIK